MTHRIYNCQLCDYTASGEHQNTILTHLQDRHGISRNSSKFMEYLREHFDLPGCACGCGRQVGLKRKGLVLNLFARDCPYKIRFINPKFLEFYLFAGQTQEQAIESLRRHQSAMGKRLDTPDHRERLSRRNSGAANPASMSSLVARTGLPEPELRAALSERSSGSRNGFHGKRHSEETKRHLARVRASQAKMISRPELAVWGMLKALDVRFEYQVPIDAYVVDFVVAGRVVEVYGDYWHGPKMSPSKRAGDDAKIARLQELGHEVIILKESDIFTNTNAVLEALRGLS